MCEDCIADALAAAANTVGNNNAGNGNSGSGPVSAGGTSVSSFHVSFSGADQTNMLALVAGSKWNSNALTFSFPDQTSDYTGSPGSYGSGELTSGFAALNASQKFAARRAFDMVEEYTNLTITEVTGNQGSADMRLAQSAVPSTAWAYYPANNEGGDSWYGTGAGYYSNPMRGTYAWHTFLHEVGHGLGLKHGHDASGYGALDAAHDQMAYSVMTYHSHTGSGNSGYTNEYYGYAQTYMMYDIAALQAVYGVNWSTRSAATTYTWSSTTGEMSVNGAGQGAPASNRIFSTIWDGGGEDTIDLSNYATDITGSIAPGDYLYFSQAQRAQLGAGIYADGNVYMALAPDNKKKAYIENLITGSGDDFVFGTTKANTIEGRGGSDQLEGLGGDDTLLGGGGRDTLIGGPGDDVLFGGIGKDTLKGNGGADVFVMDDRSGRDVAVDFQLLVDKVDVPNNGVATLVVSNTGHLTVEYMGSWMILRGLNPGDATLNDLLL